MPRHSARVSLNHPGAPWYQSLNPGAPWSSALFDAASRCCHWRRAGATEGSKGAVLGSYQSLPKETSKLVLLDFTKVDYINSSGIALVIQVLIEASNSGQKVNAFGLSQHFTKVFTMVGITKYASIFPTQADALAAL